ncbi:uncharacterized protein B0H18DRAFT_1122137 [Fomitopsis serialis]|uniref:uncharacterized protein n=1 Tax=Fomitopsis serialis TaxID=139415 RepID=UPI002007F600|nr:uncharacterized protein B0H18DRAFT_1122137 [Neoantrodia serialis]KAH9920177.1 hypothetical protein B0H18DRAFT_1122137 [Neoantrodia serialis]
MESTPPYMSTVPSPSADLDPYDAMILEYIDEEHIIALDLLPHLFPRTSAQPTVQQDSSSNPPVSSWSTELITTSNVNAQTANVAITDGLNAATTSAYPFAVPDNEGQSIVATMNAPVGGNTINDAAVHATTPLAILDHFEEWRAYMNSLGQSRAASSDSGTWINIDASDIDLVTPLMAAGLEESG